MWHPWKNEHKVGEGEEGANKGADDAFLINSISSWGLLCCFAETLCFPMVCAYMTGWMSWGAAPSFLTLISCMSLAVSELLRGFGSVCASCMLVASMLRWSNVCDTVCAQRGFLFWGKPLLQALPVVCLFPPSSLPGWSCMARLPKSSSEQSPVSSRLRLST